MTLFPGTGVSDPYLDALRVVAAASDLVRGLPAGTSVRGAVLARRAAAALELAAEEAEAAVVATLFAGAGALGAAGDDCARVLDAVRFAREAGLLPLAALDAIRWHRECWDGTGIPDALRRDAIPRSAAVAGGALRLSEMVAELGDSTDAAYALLAKGGRELDPELALTLHHQMLGHRDEPADELAAFSLEESPAVQEPLLTVLAAAVDERSGRLGRTSRIVHRVRIASNSLGLDPVSAGRAVMLARLAVLAEILDAAQLASILAAIPRYAALAPAVLQCAAEPSGETAVALVQAAALSVDDAGPLALAAFEPAIVAAVTAANA